MKKNEIAREVGAILSKEYGGSGKYNFNLTRSIVKLVVDRLIQCLADFPKVCPTCNANHGDSTCDEFQQMMAEGENDE